jgi:GNAT superfamily N-acetyltransferase
VSDGLRQARPADAVRIERLCAAAFGFERDPVRLDRFRARTGRLLGEDPDGCWVVEGPEGDLDAVAISILREGIWVLVTLATHPAAQSSGAGRRAIAAAWELGRQAEGHLIGSSDDPRAWRLYHGLGLTVHPAVSAHGKLDRTLVPALPGVRDGDATDLEACAAIDRDVRGGARVRDLEALLADGDAFYRTDGGYAFGLRGHVQTVVARTEEEAVALLWRVWADAPDDREAGTYWITGGQDWALRTAFAARLRVEPDGAVCAGGAVGPLAPWIPHGALL